MYGCKQSLKGVYRSWLVCVKNLWSELVTQSGVGITFMQFGSQSVPWTCIVCTRVLLHMCWRGTYSPPVMALVNYLFLFWQVIFLKNQICVVKVLLSQRKKATWNDTMNYVTTSMKNKLIVHCATFIVPCIHCTWEITLLTLLPDTHLFLP